MVLWNHQRLWVPWSANWGNTSPTASLVRRLPHNNCQLWRRNSVRNSTCQLPNERSFPPPWNWLKPKSRFGSKIVEPNPNACKNQSWSGYVSPPVLYWLEVPLASAWFHPLYWVGPFHPRVSRAFTHPIRATHTPLPHPPPTLFQRNWKPKNLNWDHREVQVPVPMRKNWTSIRENSFRFLLP